MKRLLLVAMFVTLLSANEAKADIGQEVFSGVTAADVAVGFGEGATVVGTATVLTPLFLTYAVATNVDPWHPLACALFGGDARVGSETEAHCN